jgi:carbonic anhydrase
VVRHDRLCELNVTEQVANVCRTTVVREAWARGQELAVHGWVYGLGDGLLRDLTGCVTSERELPP